MNRIMFFKKMILAIAGFFAFLYCINQINIRTSTNVGWLIFWMFIIDNFMTEITKKESESK